MYHKRRLKNVNKNPITSVINDSIKSTDWESLIDSMSKSRNKDEKFLCQQIQEIIPTVNAKFAVSDITSSLGLVIMISVLKTSNLAQTGKSKETTIKSCTRMVASKAISENSV